MINRPSVSERGQKGLRKRIERNAGFKRVCVDLLATTVRENTSKNGLFTGGGEILRKASDPVASLSKHCGSGVEDLLALTAQLALRSDVPVERHGFYPEFSAEFGHGGVAVSHRGLGQPHLGFRQRELEPMGVFPSLK